MHSVIDVARLKRADLAEIAQKAIWLSAWTIHNADHLRDKVDGLKVGGHRASTRQAQPLGPVDRSGTGTAGAAVRRSPAAKNGILLAGLPRDCLIVTVIDGHPATLSWPGAVHGQRVAALGVEHFGQTGTVADLYRHFGITRDAIVAAAGALAPGRPLPLEQGVA